MHTDDDARSAAGDSGADENDPVQAALRAVDEAAAALQAHLTQEHGVAVEDRNPTVAPTLDLLRHARVRIAVGLQEAKRLARSRGAAASNIAGRVDTAGLEEAT
jgi:hypothetical protein